MPIPPDPTLTEAPDAPIRGEDRTVFANKANAFVSWMTVFQGQINNVITWMRSVFTATETEAYNAAQSAASASDQVTLAADQVALAADQVSLAAGEADRAEAAADNASSQANFGGLWADLTGSVAPPLSTYHDGQYWQLLTPLADVTSVEPGTDAGVWLLMSETSLDVGGITYSFADLTASGLFVEPGLTYLQSAFPELFDIVGVGDAPPITKLPSISPDPAGIEYGAAYSGDDTYLAFAHATTPFLSVFSRSGDTFTKLADPVSIPVFNSGRDVAVSSDGTYFLVAGPARSNPRLVAYKRTGSTLARLADPVFPTGRAQSVGGLALDPSDTYLCATVSQSPYFCAFKRDGDVFNRLADPAGFPSTYANKAAWSKDGVHVAFALVDAPYLAIYKRTGDTFTKLADPAVMPSSSARSVAWTPDGKFLAVGYNSSDLVAIYERSGDTFTRVSGLSASGTQCRFVGFSPDGKYLAIGTNFSPFAYLFTVSETGVPSSVPFTPSASGNIGCGAFANTIMQFTTGSAGVDTWKGDYPFDPSTEFYVPDVDPLTPTSIGDWVPGVQGDPYVRAK